MLSLNRASLPFTLILLTILTACDGDQCRIQPLKENHKLTSVEIKAAADLGAAAATKNKANLETAIKKTSDSTYQTIPDKDIACQMILQCFGCAATRKGVDGAQLFSSLLSWLGTEKNACKPQIEAARSLFAIK
jgi:hypothetical protein